MTASKHHSSSAASPAALAAELRLVKMALSGDAVSRQEITERLEDVSRMLNGLNSRAGRPFDVHDLADLTQDTIIVILKRLPTFEARAPLQAWVFRVVELQFLNARRRLSRTLRPAADAELAAIVDENEQSRRAREGEDEQLHRAIDRVGGVEADVIRSKHFEAMTFEAVASRFELTVSTAKARYYRGIAKLGLLLRELRQGEAQ